jgi:hypothetical protein
MAHETRSLHDLIGVAVLAWQHRAGQPARDAAIPQAEVFVAVERPVPEAAGSRRIGDPRTRLRKDRRNLAVLRVDDEPGTGTFGDLVDVAELGRVADEACRIAAEELGACQRVFLSPRDRLCQFVRGDVLPCGVLRILSAARTACSSRICSCSSLAGPDRPMASAARSTTTRLTGRRAARVSLRRNRSEQGARRRTIDACASPEKAGVTLRPGARTVKTCLRHAVL